ncbi:MAG: hypothetical protein M3384_10670, partial [Acidobacteriota bacterium]|nr:hypothetical protein [Acidobacteriota bacterium]
YITERLLISGSDQPNVFTPGAIDFIFQCSEGIPRQINNLCDNAMLAGYAAGEQIISRAIIEEVADNLDLLPRRENLRASQQKTENVGVAPRVLTEEAREELWNPKPRIEPPPQQQQQQPQQQQPQQQQRQQPQPPSPPQPPIKPKVFQSEATVAANGSINGNGNGNGKVAAGATLNGNGNRNGNGKYKPFGDLDDEINLEIGETGGLR